MTPLQLKEKLKPGHVIHTLISEHEMILGFLKELEKLSSLIQKMRSFPIQSEVLQKIKNVAEHLIEAEFHHQREEEALFPEIENRGVIGPTEVMRQEHQKLRGKKKMLKEILKGTDKPAFKRKLADCVVFLTVNLRNHINKEDNILYPIAIEAIEESSWAKIKKACDKIGYCCFTPRD